MTSRLPKKYFDTRELRSSARPKQQEYATQDSRARLAGQARRGGNPICPRRAFLACLALHAPRPVALADFFSIQLGLRSGMADAVAEQIAALKDEDWAIREEAATMLGTLRDPRAVAPLVSVLRDGDRAVRDAAIGA